jgi:hypothetical protein
MSRPIWTTEAILIHPKAMGLTTATPVQRAACRALDGLPLGELADCAEVQAAFGGPEACAALPVGAAPAEFHLFASIRSAKTMIAGARILCATQTIDDSGCSPGDIVRVLVLALKLDGTRALMTHLLAAVKKPLLRPLVIGEPTDSLIVIRHPSGRPIEITPIPMDRAGGSGTTTWVAAVAVDEEPRQIGEADGVKNWHELHRAVAGRILPGGSFVGAGSLHAPWGPAFDLVRDYFGRPTRDVVVFRGTGPAMNPAWWTPERCDALRRRDPEAYRSDVLCEFRASEQSAFPLDAVDAAMGAKPPVDGEMGAPIVAVDLSAMKHDAIAIAVLRWVRPSTSAPKYIWNPTTAEYVPNPYARVKPVLWCEYIEGIEPGRQDGPVTGEKVADRVVDVAQRFGARMVAGDQYEELSFPALVRERDASLRYQVFRWSGGAAGSKGPAIERLRTLLVARQVCLPEHPRLREELVRFRRVVTQSGERFEAAAGETHGDYVSAIITGVMADLEGRMPLSTIPSTRGMSVRDDYTGETTTYG